MGGSESREKSTKLSVFTQEELKNIHSVYGSITGNQKNLTEPFLLKVLPDWLDHYLSERLFKVMCSCQANVSSNHDNKHISEAQFGAFLGEALKGTFEEKADLISVFSERDQAGISIGNLYKTVFSVIRSYVSSLGKDKNYTTWQCKCAEEDISRLTHHVLGTDPAKDPDWQTERRELYQVEEWLPKSHIFLPLFDRIWHKLFRITPLESREAGSQSLFPCASCMDWKKSGTILDSLSVVYLNYNIPREHQSIWRLLYSNSLHGDSFSQLVTNITGKGPCILVIKDTDGHMFGAYVSESWEINSQFFGSSKCFLFSLKPKFGIYTATGYNENFMYLNQGVQTLPNGLGMGGQLDYFGLWIDSSFNHGHSKAVPSCTTYGSPQLSGKPEFTVEMLEVWAVGPPQKKKQDADEDDEGPPKPKSALDTNLEAQAILAMAGKKQHSEGIRELGEEEPLTEEMKRKMNTIPKLL